MAIHPVQRYFIFYSWYIFFSLFQRIFSNFQENRGNAWSLFTEASGSPHVTNWREFQSISGVWSRCKLILLPTNNFLWKYKFAFWVFWKTSNNILITLYYVFHLQLSVRGKNKKEKISGFFRNVTQSADEAILSNHKVF